MNQTQHEELSQLFAQHMQVSQQQQQAQQEQAVQQFQQEQPARHVPQAAPQLIEPVPPPRQEKQAEDPQPIHFVSNHYNPNTAHIRPDTTSEPSRSPPPPYHEALMPEAMAETLRQHSIDPNALLPNQIHLFQNADHEQRLRLLELWRIAPPSYPLEEHLNGTWVGTTVEREEVLARVRFEEQQRQQLQQQQQQQQQHQQQGYRMVPPQEEHMLDTFIPIPSSSEPISPIREAGEDPWPPAARMKVAAIASGHSRVQSMAEPYIVAGYNPHQSVDPVYAAAANLWEAPSYAHAVEQEQLRMEDQYGMYEQIRNHADWERRNEILAREKLAVVQAGGEDYDMEL
jgi:hypothetical protein